MRRFIRPFIRTRKLTKSSFMGSTPSSMDANTTQQHANDGRLRFHVKYGQS